MTYDGTVYIGVVGPDMIPVQAVISIMNIQRRPGDAAPRFQMATKGYEARQIHINQFLDSEHDWILLLDHDMIFPGDTLERLRSHGRPYVSGLYMRRRHSPMLPVWYEPYMGEWSMMPFTADPERGRLHELGASGWGCILIHRTVIEETRFFLGGEWEVIEDDMDVDPVTGEVLLGTKKPVGSDLRYPMFARRAGFVLYGDPDVRASHILSYPLSPDDYSGTPQLIRDQWASEIRRQVLELRAERRGGGG